MRYALLFSILITCSACGTTLSKYESPNYRLIVKEGDFEVRHYEPALMAVTKSSSANNGFRKLFGFISGDNSQGKEISMTVPVRVSEQKPESSMAFFMPHKYSTDNLPHPTNDDVALREFSGGLYAAHRFSGLTSSARIERKQKSLVDWAAERGYLVTDERYLDRYDPPWTLWFLRTNEVLVKLDKARFAS